VQFGRWRVGSKGPTDPVGHLYASQVFGARLRVLERLVCLHGEGSSATYWYTAVNMQWNCVSVKTSVGIAR